MRILSEQGLALSLLVLASLTLSGCGPALGVAGAVAAAGGGGGGGGGGGASTEVTANAFTDFPASGNVQSLNAANLNVNSGVFLNYKQSSGLSLIKLDALEAPNILAAAGSPIALPSTANRSSLAAPVFLQTNLAAVATANEATGADAILYLFDPTNVSAPGDFTVLDLSQGTLLDIQPLAGLTDSDGQTTPNYRATFPADVLLAPFTSQDLLFVAFRNVRDSIFFHPGTVLVFNIDLTQSPPTITRIATLFTTGYGPISLDFRFDSPRGRFDLNVLCGGSFGPNNDHDATIDVFDAFNNTGLSTNNFVNEHVAEGFLSNNGKTFVISSTDITNDQFEIFDLDLDALVINNTVALDNPNSDAIAVAGSESNTVLYVQFAQERMIKVVDIATGQILESIPTPTPAPRFSSGPTDAPLLLFRGNEQQRGSLFSIVNLSGGSSAVDLIVPRFQ